MKFQVSVNILPQDALLDPQGKAVLSSLQNLGLTTLADVRVGKHIALEIDADNINAAKEIAESACNKLLVNKIMEKYELDIKELV